MSNFHKDEINKNEQKSHYTARDDGVLPDHKSNVYRSTHNKAFTHGKCDAHGGGEIVCRKTGDKRVCRGVEE